MKREREKEIEKKKINISLFHYYLSFYHFPFFILLFSGFMTGIEGILYYLSTDKSNTEFKITFINPYIGTPTHSTTIT